MLNDVYTIMYLNIYCINNFYTGIGLLTVVESVNVVLTTNVICDIIRNR